MFFKPRIFISSIMRGSLKKRDAIRKLLSECGAEVLLYEKNLTPSTNKNTYRRDILESDFVILILDEEYGAVTETGVSGTEEEFDIAMQYGLKTHIYLKKAAKHSKKEKELEKRIKEAGISYYYYDSDADLLKRIKSSVMTIAKEITINSIDTNALEEKKLFELAQNHDYKVALIFIELHNKMIRCCNRIESDIHSTDIVTSFTEMPYYWLSGNDHIFVNPKYEELLLKAYKIADEYSQRHSREYTSLGIQAFANIEDKNWGGISVNYLKPTGYEIDHKWYEEKLDQYIESFNVFIKYVKDKRIEIDSL